MHDYIIAIILIPVYILLALLGRRFLKFAHGYEKGLEDAEKIRKMEENKLLDEIRAEIEENINYNKRMNYQGIVAGLLLTLDIIGKYR